jgi:cold shock CspA family protein
MTMTDNGRKLGVVRRAFPDRGFYFIRELIPQPNGPATMDKDGSDIFLHSSRLRASGFAKLEQQDVIYFDTHVSPRNGRIEAISIWPAS